MSKVLFVGNDKALAEMIAKLLRRDGFDVICAVGGEDALNCVQSQQIAVVVADLEESSSDVSRFCQNVKSYSKGTKLLIISANVQDEEPILSAGADDWLKKPYNMKILCARIKVLLR